MTVLVSYTFTILIDIIFGSILLKRKRSLKYASFLFIINYIIFVLGYCFYKSFLIHTSFSQIVPTILGFIFAIYFLLAFKESLSKKIFTMFTVRLFSIIILIISSYVMSLFSINDYNIYKSLSILLRNFIQLMFIPIVYFHFKNPYKEMLKFVSNKFTNIITFYSIIIFFFLGKYYRFDPFNNSYDNEIISSLFFIFIIILSYIIIFMAIYYVNRNIELEYKFKFIGTQIELQKQNYKTLNKSLESYYAFKHDTRHHLLAIKSLMDTKNYMAASEYLEKFNENVIGQKVEVLCKNFTVDSILKYYRNTAINNNIDFKVNVNIPQAISIDNLELAVVIGNCVENSIEACNNMIYEGKKFINIKAEIKGSQLVIKIINSFYGKIIKESNIIKTSKSGEEHGIGLYNVRNIVEKYKGYFNIKYDNNEVEVHIVMNFN